MCGKKKSFVRFSTRPRYKETLASASALKSLTNSVLCLFCTSAATSRGKLPTVHAFGRAHRWATVRLRHLQQDVRREKLRHCPQVCVHFPFVFSWLTLGSSSKHVSPIQPSPRWSHVSEKPLSCDRCSMTFTSKTQFAVHIRTHSAGQNYECNVCGRTFIRDSYLIR